MKMTLSTPRTISRNVSVASAIQICGSVSQSIRAPSVQRFRVPGLRFRVRFRVQGSGFRSDAVAFWIPLESELGRRSHVANQRRRGDDGWAGEIAFATDAHPILPVAVEGRDRALSLGERVRSLAEAGTAPGL